MLNSRANDLKIERERLLAEQRRIMEALTPLPSDIRAPAFRRQLVSFAEIVEEARPEQLQRLMRLMVKQIAWHPEGTHGVQFYAWPQLAKNPKQAWPHPLKEMKDAKTSPETPQDWFATNVRLGCPLLRSLEPIDLAKWLRRFIKRW